jgi:hypothetical protein
MLEDTEYFLFSFFMVLSQRYPQDFGDPMNQPYGGSLWQPCSAVISRRDDPFGKGTGP